MFHFIEQLEKCETIRDEEALFGILEDFIWVNAYFSQHGVFQIEEY